MLCLSLLKEMFLDHQIIILECFLKGHVTLTEDWSNDAENSAFITGINYNLFLK